MATVSKINYSKELQAILDKNGIKPENVLYLNIVMGPMKRIATGEKVVEFRDYTDWYTKKLCNVKNGVCVSEKPITHILFQNGMDPDSPRMLIGMTGWLAKDSSLINPTQEQSKLLMKEAEKEGFEKTDEYIGLFLSDILYTDI